MKKLLPALAICLLCGTSTFAAEKLNSDTGKLSYSMGYRTGQAMKTESMTVSVKDFTKGLQDGYIGSKPQLSENDMQSALTTMQKEMAQKMQQKNETMSAQNKKDGEMFLAKNATEAGVMTLPPMAGEPAIQYKILTKGTGPTPSLNDTVTVNYEGTFTNNTVFDSSYQRGKPATFKVSDVIKGWQEALTHMPVGSTWMIYIPSALAYGAQGSGPIGPNETLVFKVDLISKK